MAFGKAVHLLAEAEVSHDVGQHFSPGWEQAAQGNNLFICYQNTINQFGLSQKKAVEWDQQKLQIGKYK